MGLFTRNKNPVVNRNLYASGGKIPTRSSDMQLLQSNQLIERALAFVEFDTKMPNPFESTNEFIVHMVNAHTAFNGVTVVQSSGYWYVADVLTDTGLGSYQFTSNIRLGTPKTMTGVVPYSAIQTVHSSMLSSMSRVTPDANNLLNNAISTVLRRLTQLGKISLIWKRKGNRNMETQKEKNEADLGILNGMATNAGGVMTANIEDDFFQVQPDYSKADGTEVAGSIAIFSYVTGISPEYLRGAQSDQQVVNSVLQILKPLLVTLNEKTGAFKATFDFTQLATLQQSQAKGDSTKLTPQAVQSSSEVTK